MYYNRKLEANQINNLYYSCVNVKIKAPNISAQIDALIQQSKLLGEKGFLDFLIDWVIIIENKISFVCDYEN